MPARTRAGLLAYRVGPAGQMWVFLGHMGGPFWARRDQGGWSIPKGEYAGAEEAPVDVARREFAEEIGVPAPVGDLLDLGEVPQPSDKRGPGLRGRRRRTPIGRHVGQLPHSPPSDSRPEDNRSA